MKYTLVVLLAIILSSSSSADQAAFVTDAMVAVKDRLKDPDAAQFKGVVYGEVNGKNNSGDYIGYQRFRHAKGEDGKHDVMLENEYAEAGLRGDFDAVYSICQTSGTTVEKKSWFSRLFD